MHADVRHAGHRIEQAEHGDVSEDYACSTCLSVGIPVWIGVSALLYRAALIGLQEFAGSVLLEKPASVGLERCDRIDVERMLEAAFFYITQSMIIAGLIKNMLQNKIGQT